MKQISIDSFFTGLKSSKCQSSSTNEKIPKKLTFVNLPSKKNKRKRKKKNLNLLKLNRKVDKRI